VTDPWRFMRNGNAIVFARPQWAILLAKSRYSRHWRREGFFSNADRASWWMASVYCWLRWAWLVAFLITREERLPRHFFCIANQWRKWMVCWVRFGRIAKSQIKRLFLQRRDCIRVSAPCVKSDSAQQLLSYHGCCFNSAMRRLPAGLLNRLILVLVLETLIVISRHRARCLLRCHFKRFRMVVIFSRSTESDTCFIC